MKFYLKDRVVIFLFAFIFIFIGISKINTYQDYNSTVIVENHNFINKQNKELLKDDKVTEEFKAVNNNLGTISVRFNTYDRVNIDYLQFSIKESGANHWYYSNKYKINQFQNNQYFPFGFPAISNSRGKIYQIEIKSLGGVEGESIQILMNDSPYLSKYSFPKAYLQQNKKEIPLFILSKIISYFNHIDSSVYLYLLVITLSMLYLLRFINIKQLLESFKRLEKILFKSNKSFFIKLKENKLIKLFFVIISILSLYIVNLSVNWPIRLKAFSFGDDLSSWHYFDINRNNFFGFIFSTGANKFRPVFLSVFFALFNLIGNKIWLYGDFLIIFNFLISAILFFIFRKISNNAFVSLCLSLAFILSRFAYYDITQAMGLMEAMALLFSIFILYLLWRYLNTEKIKYYWISIIVFFVLLLTHERFITLLLLYFMAFLLLRFTPKNIKLFIIASLPIIFIWSFKILILKIRPFDGTGGTDIFKTFQITSFFQYILSGWFYIFGTNAGPAYLNGISSEAVPKNINNLILFGNICLFFISAIFGIIVLKSKKILKNNYINNFILFFTFVFSTLIAASVTFRLEMRWLYAPFVGLLFLISYMIKVILTDNILGKISLIFIMIWLCLVAPVGIFYRSYYKNLYYWGSQTFGNSLYENTLEKYGENFWKLKTYIYCSEKSSYYMLGCSDYINVNYFFKQYKKKEEKSFIYLINKISEIPKEINSQKILLLTYDQSEGKFINLKIGTELRKTILKNGWYGWSDDKTSIWTGNDVEALFKTGDKGEMTLEGFIPEYNLPNTVTFFIDDKLISKFYIENPNIKINIETPENKIINLRFTVDHFKSPAELKVGADVRELEILVTDIKFK